MRQAAPGAHVMIKGAIIAIQTAQAALQEKTGAEIIAHGIHHLALAGKTGAGILTYIQIKQRARLLKD